ncbi:MAG: LacI family DNA-binding transcriptional regulator [Saprospiraceae bacterium]|nr:MAG: LacI family DNA-binding transcriptional regulator [Saprospiraceae bacterium]
MSRQIRIKDIAAKAGVSTGTVDRVLHERGNVSPKAKVKVLKVMEELGYERNIIASTLAYNRVFRIAALLPGFHTDPYWEQPFSGMERALKTVRHYGISLEPHFFELFDPRSFLQTVGQVLENPPDAILFAPVFLKESRTLLEACRENGIHNVMINTYVDNPDSLCYIGQDSYQSGFLAGRLLHFGLNEGETAMLLNLEVGSHNAQHLIDKERGFRDYFGQFPGQHIEIVKRDFEDFDDRQKLTSLLDDLFARHPRLNGIFFTNSRAYKAVECLPAGIVQKIKIVGFDLIEQNIRHLRKNNIDFLINQNPVHQGYMGIINLVNHLVFKKNVEKLQYLPLDIVVNENVDYYLKRQEEFEIVL